MRLQYISPLTLPRAQPTSLETATQASVYIEPPEVDRLLFRYAPEFIDDPAQTSLFSGLGADTYVSPPAFLVVLPQPILFGYRSLAWHDHFCNDESGTNPVDTKRLLHSLASQDPFPNEDTGLKPAQNGDGFDLNIARQPQRHQAGTAVVLCSHEPSNYGSFLFRVLPKLYAVRTYKLSHLPVVVYARNPAFLELLRLAGVSQAQIIQHDTGALTTFDRVIAPSLRNPHGFLDLESHALFQQLARENSCTGGERRLYVSRMGQTRRGNSTRQMLNEAEVVAAVIGLGFRVIEPEQLSLAAQIAAFASADIVVGPSGSAMFNVVFCRPGTKVLDIESEPNWIYAHTGLFASCHTQYGLFIGAVDADDPLPVHRRFRVDVPALIARITQFMRR